MQSYVSGLGVADVDISAVAASLSTPGSNPETDSFPVDYSAEKLSPSPAMSATLPQQKVQGWRASVTSGLSPLRVDRVFDDLRDDEALSTSLQLNFDTDLWPSSDADSSERSGE